MVPWGRTPRPGNLSMEPKAFALRFPPTTVAEWRVRRAPATRSGPAGAHSRTGKDRVALEVANAPIVRGRMRDEPGGPGRRRRQVRRPRAACVPGRRAAHRRGDRGQGGFDLARPPGRDGPRRGAPAPRLPHAAIEGRVAAARRPGAGTGDDTASHPSPQPRGAPRPERGLWCARSPVCGAAAKAGAAGPHFTPITMESGPARCSARVPRKPASRIQPMQSAAV